MVTATMVVVEIGTVGAIMVANRTLATDKATEPMTAIGVATDIRVAEVEAGADTTTIATVNLPTAGDTMITAVIAIVTATQGVTKTLHPLPVDMTIGTDQVEERGRGGIHILAIGTTNGAAAVAVMPPDTIGVEELEDTTTGDHLKDMEAEAVMDTVNANVSPQGGDTIMILAGMACLLHLSLPILRVLLEEEDTTIVEDTPLAVTMGAVVVAAAAAMAATQTLEVEEIWEEWDLDLIAVAGMAAEVVVGEVGSSEESLCL